MNAPISKTKLAANRANASKSTGPSITVSTRYNAVKHGLLANGITELDDWDYAHFIAEVKAELRPEGPIENFLTERICLCAIRLKRAGRLEAEFITEALNPPITKIEGGIFEDPSELLHGKTVMVDPGLPAPLPGVVVEQLAEKFQRYETSIENKFFRAMNQLERLQRLRLGEKIPAPTTLDVAIHSDKNALASFGIHEQPETN